VIAVQAVLNVVAGVLFFRGLFWLLFQAGVQHGPPPWRSRH
jgi:hypothetical protein